MLTDLVEQSRKSPFCLVDLTKPEKLRLDDIVIEVLVSDHPKEEIVTRLDFTHLSEPHVPDGDDGEPKQFYVLHLFLT
jgi:hypothetical protein